jgi:hypothetical protein
MSSSAQTTESTMGVRAMNQIDTSGFPWERIAEAIFPIYDGSMTRLQEHCVHGCVAPRQRHSGDGAASTASAGGNEQDPPVCLLDDRACHPSSIHSAGHTAAGGTPSEEVQNVAVCRQILACKERPPGALLADSIGMGTEADYYERWLLQRFDEQPVIERRVLLQREETGKNLLFAAAWIAFAILSASMLRRSQQQRTPRPLERMV